MICKKKEHLVQTFNCIQQLQCGLRGFVVIGQLIKLAINEGPHMMTSLWIFKIEYIKCLVTYVDCFGEAEEFICYIFKIDHEIFCIVHGANHWNIWRNFLFSLDLFFKKLLVFNLAVADFHKWIPRLRGRIKFIFLFRGLFVNPWCWQKWLN